MMNSKRSLPPFHFIPRRFPVISNTTMTPYPSDPDEQRRILMAHLESTVHWMNNVQTLWNDYGVRLFVEVGPGETLSNLIADTLPESACIQTSLPSAEGLIYKTALAQLFVQGHLKVEGEPRFVSFAAFGRLPLSNPCSWVSATGGQGDTEIRKGAASSPRPCSASPRPPVSLYSPLSASPAPLRRLRAKTLWRGLFEIIMGCYRIQ